jgi:hypothetical protein
VPFSTAGGLSARRVLALHTRTCQQRSGRKTTGKPPAIHHDKLLVPRPDELGRVGTGRTLDAVFSTIAVRKTGTIIAPANAMIVSTKLVMMEPFSLQAHWSYGRVGSEMAFAR